MKWYTLDSGREVEEEELELLNDTPKPDAPKPEAPKPEAPKPEAPKPEAPKPEAPKPEAPKPDAPKPVVPEADWVLLSSLEEEKNPKVLFAELLLAAWVNGLLKLLNELVEKGDWDEKGLVWVEEGAVLAFVVVVVNEEVKGEEGVVWGWVVEDENVEGLFHVDEKGEEGGWVLLFSSFLPNVGVKEENVEVGAGLEKSISGTELFFSSFLPDEGLNDKKVLSFEGFTVVEKWGSYFSAARGITLGFRGTEVVLFKRLSAADES